MIIPDKLDMLVFFESEPLEEVPEDGYYCYKLADDNGISLYFSFNEFEHSIQIRLLNTEQEVALISQEGAEKIDIIKDKSGEYISCFFNFGGATSYLKLYLKPINIKWSTLIS